MQVEIPTPAEVSAHRVQAPARPAPARAPELGRLDLYREAIAVHLAQNPDVDPVDAARRRSPRSPSATRARVRRARATTWTTPCPRAHLTRCAAASATASAATTVRSVASAARRHAHRRAARRAGASPSVTATALQPGALVGALTGEGGLTGKDVGKIDIFGSFALVDIPDGLSPDVIDRLARTRVAGRPLRIRLDQGPRPGQGASRPRTARPPAAADRTLDAPVSLSGRRGRRRPTGGPIPGDPAERRLAAG